MLIFIQMCNFKLLGLLGLRCKFYNEWCEFSNIPGSSNASLEVFRKLECE